MSKIYILLVLPLLLLLPFGNTYQKYLANQTCQMNQMSESCTCSCDHMKEQIAIDQSESCCCIKLDDSKMQKADYVAEVKPVVFETDLDFHFTDPFQLTKKSNIIQNYSLYYSLGFSSTETLIDYSPPIYLQNCSLRI